MAVAWNPEVDITPQIRAALDSADPAGTLADLWPWVPDQYRESFATQASEFLLADADREVLIQRYRYAVEAYWLDRQRRRSLLARLLRRSA